MTEKKKTFATQPSLVGDKVYLRPETADDALNAQFWFLQSEPQSMSARPLMFISPAEASEKAKKREKSPDRERFTIVLTETNQPVGTVTFFNYNPLNRSAEMGILVDPDARRKGYGRQAMQLLIKYLFLYRGLNKVYAETAGFNKETIALLESLGFKKDGTLRDHHFYKGEFHPKLVYSFLRFELDW